VSPAPSGSMPGVLVRLTASAFRRWIGRRLLPAEFDEAEHL